MTLQRAGLLAAGALWLAAIVFGLPKLWAFENTPGAGATAPQDWPAQARLPPPVSRPALIVLLHPQCACSRATVAELSRLMTRVQGRVDVHVLVLAAAGLNENASVSALWRAAASIPGVKVLLDHGGTEARHFGGATSGQALLYDTSRRLRFRGGITPSRGHEGENAGRGSLESLLDRDDASHSWTPVFGCALFDSRDDTLPRSANALP